MVLRQHNILLTLAVALLFAAPAWSAQAVYLSASTVKYGTTLTVYPGGGWADSCNMYQNGGYIGTIAGNSAMGATVYTDTTFSALCLNMSGWFWWDPGAAVAYVQCPARMDTYNGGYVLYSGSVRGFNMYPWGEMCFINYNGAHLFVPTATQGEFGSFFSAPGVGYY
jgi:hypothetical protein